MPNCPGVGLQSQSVRNPIQVFQKHIFEFCRNHLDPAGGQTPFLPAFVILPGTDYSGLWLRGMFFKIVLSHFLIGVSLKIQYSYAIIEVNFKKECSHSFIFVICIFERY